MRTTAEPQKAAATTREPSGPSVAHFGSLARIAAMADHSAPVQRLLNIQERDAFDGDPLEPIPLETRIEALTEQLPDIIQQKYNTDHPVIEPIRTELQRIRAAFGTDDDADIRAKLTEYRDEIIRMEGVVTPLLPQLNTIAQVWAEFPQEVTQMDSDLEALAGQCYRGTVSPDKVKRFHKKLQRLVMLNSKDMSKIRERSKDDAIARLNSYIRLGYVTVLPLNKFYASSYDKDEDCFGAAGKLENNTEVGAMQWLREWEFHVHAKVTRGGALNAVTGFNITVGHIKPSGDRGGVGKSVTIDHVPTLAGVTASSTQAVIRWSRTKAAGYVLPKL